MPANQHPSASDNAPEPQEPTVELPFDVFCDALHFVQAAGADGLADTLVECAAESGYVAVDIAHAHMGRQLEGWADDAG